MEHSRIIWIIGMTATLGILFLTSLTQASVLESPANGANLSGLGFISGWKCDAGTITVTLDGGGHIPVATGMPRDDTRIACGTTLNGFITQINWALVGDGEHTAVAYDDGVEFARSTFTVASTGEEFVDNAPGTAYASNWPSAGENARLVWNESTQHFELAEVGSHVVIPGAGSGPDPLRNSIGMEFVRIEAGTFMMGSDRVYNHDERPIHQVTISRPFYLGIYEVTQGEWNALMDDNPSHYPGCDECPVTGAPWAFAQEFIRRLNVQEGVSTYRLPTEAEWEYAARADGTDYTPLGDYAWCGVADGYRQAPVGQKKPNTWGLYDMLGNTYEWVQDWYGVYPSGPVTDPQGPDPGYPQIGIDHPSYTDSYYRGKITRGGARNYSASSCTVSFRYSYNFGSGFRVAKTIAGR